MLRTHFNKAKHKRALFTRLAIALFLPLLAAHTLALDWTSASVRTFEANGELYAYVTQYGDFFLKGKLREFSDVPDTPPDDCFVFFDSSPLAVINAATGDLSLRGKVIHQPYIVDNQSLKLKYYNRDNEIVAAFSEQGDLYLRGHVLCDNEYQDSSLSPDVLFAQRSLSVRLRCENQINPDCVDPNTLPRLSWTVDYNHLVQPGLSDIVQTGYEIRVYHNAILMAMDGLGALGFKLNTYLYQQRNDDTFQSVNIPLNINELIPGKRYYWKAIISYSAKINGAPVKFQLDSYQSNLYYTARESRESWFETGLQHSTTSTLTADNDWCIGDNDPIEWLGAAKPSDEFKRIDRLGVKSEYYAFNADKDADDPENKGYPHYFILDMARRQDSIKEIHLYPAQWFRYKANKLQLENGRRHKDFLNQYFLFPITHDMDQSGHLKIQSARDETSSFRVVGDYQVIAPNENQPYAKIVFQDALDGVRYIKLSFCKLAKAGDGAYGVAFAEIEAYKQGATATNPAAYAKNNNILLNENDDPSGPIVICYSGFYNLDPATPSEAAQYDISRTQFPYPAQWDPRNANDGTRITTAYPGGSVVFRRKLPPPVDPGRQYLYISALGLYEAFIVQMNEAGGIDHIVRIGDNQLAPEWTDYKSRVQYQKYDITGMLSGENDYIYVTLVDGWYAGLQGPMEWRRSYGESPKFIMQIRNYDENKDLAPGAPWCISHSGSRKLGDESRGAWEVAYNGPIRAFCHYRGEVWDEDKADFNNLIFTTNGIESWPVTDVNSRAKPIVKMQQEYRHRDGLESNPYDINYFAEEDLHHSISLQPQSYPPMKFTQLMTPVRPAWRQDDGAWVFDFGQNIVGRPRMRYTVPANTFSEVGIVFADFLSQEGEKNKIYLACNKGNYAMDLCKKDNSQGAEPYIVDFQPRFSRHPFRYMAVYGLEETPAADPNFIIEAYALHNALERTIDFECSSRDLNQLMRNIMWTQRNALMGMVADCSNRQEALSYANNNFMQTSMYNMNMAPLYRKVLGDFFDTRRGTEFSLFAPTVSRNHFMWNFHGWSDGVFEIPYYLYVNYGDDEAIQSDSIFDGFRDYLDHVLSENTGLISYNEDTLWDPGYYYSRHFFASDWLNESSIYTTPSVKNGWGDHLGPPTSQSATDYELTGMAFIADDCRKMHLMDLIKNGSQSLEGSVRLHATYGELFERIKAVFKQWYTPDSIASGHVRNSKTDNSLVHTQGAYALPVFLGLLDDVSGIYALRLAQIIMNCRYDPALNQHLTTGNHGAWRTMRVLGDSGQFAAAYAALFQRGCPGWLYMIDQGATTVWERWDTMLEDRTTSDSGYPVPFARPVMNSASHPMFCGVGEFIYRYIGGLHPDEELINDNGESRNVQGYKEFMVKFRPSVEHGLTRARTEYQSAHGRIVIQWELQGATDDSELRLNVAVPPNASAKICMPAPGGANYIVTDQAKHQFASGGMDEDYLEFTVGSGRHEFIRALVP
ncbi:family 78 glycoside hydrolase catalytic domain [Candidatus Sumerlaeota bacterium]|nr:family 78 glycoside hydrolase catalytic domain [Candidatus Sumerlaeota bacterium]